MSHPVTPLAAVSGREYGNDEPPSPCALAPPPTLELTDGASAYRFNSSLSTAPLPSEALPRYVTDGPLTDGNTGTQALRITLSRAFREVWREKAGKRCPSHYSVFRFYATQNGQKRRRAPLLGIQPPPKKKKKKIEKKKKRRKKKKKKKRGKRGDRILENLSTFLPS